jgi:ribonuclease I
VHSIENPNNGISVRAIKEAFRLANDAKKSKHVSISCSFLQIYNEKVYDLLNTSKMKSKN